MRGLITGASGKIGRYLVERLIFQKWSLVLQGNQSISSLKTQFQGKKGVFCLKKNLEVPGAARELVQEGVKCLGGLDVLMHLASTFEKRFFGEMSEEEWDRDMAIDLKAAYFLAQEGVRQMTNGTLLFFSDLQAHTPSSHRIAYRLAKEGLEAMTKHLVKSCGERSRVMTIVLPGIDSEREMTHLVDGILELLHDSRRESGIYDFKNLSLLLRPSASSG